jgi:capsular exopolysaccharide synthesis family protein
MTWLLRRPKKKQEVQSEGPSWGLVTVTEPASAASEAYRTLRTNLFYSATDTPPKVILITSPSPRTGKSTTCANLGVVMAQAGKSTLITDCDLRKSAMHKIFGLRNTYGLMNVFAQEGEPQEFWHEPLKGLHVLTAGLQPPNPPEVLSSQLVAEFLKQMRREFDYVLLDAPPTQLVSDAVILAPQTDGVLLILDAQRTRKGLVRQAMHSLETVGARVLGTVITNAVAASRDSQYQELTYY